MSKPPPHPRGITLTAFEVRAVGEGRLGRIWRVVKRRIGPDIDPERLRLCRPMRRGKYAFMGNDQLEPICEISLKPFAFPGDVLFVKETWQTHCDMDAVAPKELKPGTAIQYPATYDGWVSKRRSAQTLPAWASRFTIRIGDVSVKRIQDVTEQEAMESGIEIPKEAGNPYWTPQEWADSRLTRFAHQFGVDNGVGLWTENVWAWSVGVAKV